MNETDKLMVISLASQAEIVLHERNPDVPSDVFGQLVTMAKRICKDTYKQQTPMCFLVDFSFRGSTESPLVEQEARNLVGIQSRYGNSALVVTTIGLSGHIKEIATAEWEGRLPSELWAAQLSERHATIAIHIYGRTIHIFDRGTPVERWLDVFRPTYPMVPPTKHRHCREYRELIEDHFNDCVVDQKAFPYWANKADRLLENKPERYFHYNLWWYLKEFCLDARSVDKERQVDGYPDETDIWISSTSDEEYLLEVKWLGKSESGTEYDSNRAREGARQVNIYLDKFPQVTRAGLVLYDARKTDEEIQYAPEEMEPKVDLDLRFWLPSESASVAARRRSKK